MKKRILTAALCALILLVSAAAFADSGWECPGCGRRIRDILGDTCPYCGTHHHVWAPATCTEPETCACGAQRGEPAGHRWDEGVVVKPATCVSAGVTRYTCMVCALVREEHLPLDPGNHQGETETRNAKEPLCEQDGYSGDIFCESCGNEISSGHVIPAPGHVYTQDAEGQPLRCEKCGHQKTAVTLKWYAPFDAWDTLINGSSVTRLIYDDEWQDRFNAALEGCASLDEARLGLYYDRIWFADQDHEIAFMDHSFDAAGVEDCFYLVKFINNRQEAQETISDLDNALRKNDVNAETGDSTGSENINDLFRSMTDFTLTYKNLEILYYADKDLFIIESPLIEPWPSVTFGRYEQDNDVSNGPEPIQWDVISSDKGKLLLLSEHALDCVPYIDDSSADARRFGDTYLCEWLNGEFLGAAFTGEEAAVLQRDDNGDRVLVPGVKDMRNNSHRYCVPTKYALARGVETEKFYSVDCCGWWLDSIMDTDGDGYAEYGAMDAKGEVFYVPYGLVDDGVAVRPAIWVDAEEMIGLDSK